MPLLGICHFLGISLSEVWNSYWFEKKRIFFIFAFLFHVSTSQTGVGVLQTGHFLAALFVAFKPDPISIVLCRRLDVPVSRVLPCGFKNSWTMCTSHKYTNRWSCLKDTRTHRSILGITINVFLWPKVHCAGNLFRHWDGAAGIGLYHPSSDV